MSGRSVVFTPHWPCSTPQPATFSSCRCPPRCAFAPAPTDERIVRYVEQRTPPRLRRQRKVRRPGHHPARRPPGDDPNALVGHRPLIALARMLRNEHASPPTMNTGTGLCLSPSAWGLRPSSPRRRVAASAPQHFVVERKTARAEAQAPRTLAAARLDIRELPENTRRSRTSTPCSPAPGRPGRRADVRSRLPGGGRPGALCSSAAPTKGHQVVPLVGPSSLLLA